MVPRYRTWKVRPVEVFIMKSSSEKMIPMGEMMSNSFPVGPPSGDW